MDAFRQIMAAVLVSALVPLLFYWPVIHGCIRFWRRIGPGRTFLATWTGMLVAAVGLFRIRETYLQADFGTNGLMMALGAAGLGIAGWLHVLLYRDITNTFLIGLPEVAPDRRPQPLVCTGLYARVRHPRYVQLMIAMIGWALIANHLASYAVCLLWLLALPFIAALEERELRARYGDAYARYARVTPRFLPRLRP